MAWCPNCNNNQPITRHLSDSCSICGTVFHYRNQNWFGEAHPHERWCRGSVSGTLDVCTHCHEPLFASITDRERYDAAAKTESEALINALTECQIDSGAALIDARPSWAPESDSEWIAALAICGVGGVGLAFVVPGAGLKALMVLGGIALVGLSGWWHVSEASWAEQTETMRRDYKTRERKRHKAEREEQERELNELLHGDEPEEEDSPPVEASPAVAEHQVDLLGKISEEGRKRIYSCLIKIAYSDGEVPDEERKVLSEYRDRMGVSAKVATQLELEAQGGGLRLSKDKAEGQFLMEALLALVSADGVYTPEEEAWVRRIGEKLGYTTATLSAMIAKHGLVSRAESPGKRPPVR